jgi:long-chain acyl-CoA synthetase
MMEPDPAAWTKAYEPGVPPDLPTAERSFDSILAAAAADAPSAPALGFYQRWLRYAELETQVARAASALQRHGVRPGERVLIALPNCPSFAIAALGALRAGAVATPLDPGADRETVRRRLAQMAPRLAIASPAALVDLSDDLTRGGTMLVVADPAHDLPLGLRLIRALAQPMRGSRPGPSDLGTPWATWIADASGHEPAGVDLDAPALDVTLCTGMRSGEAADGTSFTHRHLVAGAQQIQLWFTDAMAGDDPWLLLQPLASAFGFVAGLGAAMLLRDRVALLPAWTPEDIESALTGLRPSFVATDGRTMSQLIGAPELARLDRRSVRAWITGSPLDVDTVSTFEGATGMSLCLGYAPPGVAGLATCNPINGRRAAGTVGVPLPGVRARLTPVGAPEESGTLELAGPNIAAAGWLRTPIPAQIDPSGYVTLDPAPGIQASRP